MLEPPHPAKVYVVDDDIVLRQLLRGIFVAASLSVDTFGSGYTFLEAYEDEPGCVLLDIDMPGVDGLDVQDELLARGARLPVIMMAGFADVRMAVRAFRHGAWDFVEKPIEPQSLLTRIRRAFEYDSSSRRLHARRHEALRLYAQLTRREAEVFDLVVAGQINKEIATTLCLSPKTVESHRAKIMHKLNVHSVPELVRISMQLDTPAPAPQRFLEIPERAFA